MRVIELKNISKVYNPKGIAVNAVNNVSLSFNQGEFTAIVGASGSGKTTLLNMIGGIDTPTNGEVIIENQKVNTLSESKLTTFRRDNIGFIFQQYNLLPVLTAIENVEFILELQGKQKREREQRAKELLIAIGLGDKLNERPGKLSGGQQQRVAVARALAHKPKFIIADEPTANLDSKSTSDLLEMMLSLNQKEGITFIFSTHDNRVVEKAKRVIVFEDGRVIEDTVNS
jgi:putative ABC transport system ATP-binding protein